jgi:hypothetical protein
MSITTEKATIQVSFSKEKLDALKFYMCYSANYSL